MPDNCYDLVIIGAGPAGLTAAIYARRAGKTVMILEKETFGGQITHSPKVENYPGFPAISGVELAEHFIDQALGLGAELDVDAVTGVTRQDDGFEIRCERSNYQARAVIIATGAKPRRLGVPREDEFTGNGVSYCVLCDGAFFAGKHVAVIGGGNTALQDAVLLSDTCRQVTVVQNLAFLTGEQQLIDLLKSRENVDYLYNRTVESLEGEGELSALALRDAASGNIEHLAVDGVFVAIGQVPENTAFADVCALDERGYIIADENCLTGCDGVFVAGDCRTKTVRQITTATGDGAAAALAACRYLEQQH